MCTYCIHNIEKRDVFGSLLSFPLAALIFFILQWQNHFNTNRTFKYQLIMSGRDKCFSDRSVQTFPLCTKPSKTKYK